MQICIKPGGTAGRILSCPSMLLQGQFFCPDPVGPLAGKENIMKNVKERKTAAKITALLMCLVLAFAMTACGGSDSESSDEGSASESGKTFKVGICNYVDDASLNQIVENIEDQLEVQEKEQGVTFDVDVENCNADANVMNQIIQDYIADDVDLMVGVATPVAVGMQAATEDNKIPVVFAAVSDPEDAGLVASNEKPGANITGTSDYLDTNAVFDLMLAQNPDVKKVGLLYDQGQDSSKTPIAHAKEYLKKKNIEIVEHTGTTVDEVQLAADAMVADKVDAVFTPTDNTIMTAELSIYKTFAEAKIPHYTGADSFALNGAFLGYGVDYANLGKETGNMISDILVNEKNPGEVPVLTFDNGTATVNTDICKDLGLDYDELAKTFEPYCNKVQKITTSEDFED